jgi:hypothetical protein
MRRGGRVALFITPLATSVYPRREDAGAAQRVARLKPYGERRIKPFRMSERQRQPAALARGRRA